MAFEVIIVNKKYKECLAKCNIDYEKELIKLYFEEKDKQFLKDFFDKKKREIDKLLEKYLSEEISNEKENKDKKSPSVKGLKINEL